MATKEPLTPKEAQPDYNACRSKSKAQYKDGK